LNISHQSILGKGIFKNFDVKYIQEQAITQGSKQTHQYVL